MGLCEHCGKPAIVRIYLDFFLSLLVINPQNELQRIETGEFCRRCAGEILDDIPPSWLVGEIPLDLSKF